jgi:polyhydroxybutyrate depolymerase
MRTGSWLALSAFAIACGGSTQSQPGAPADQGDGAATDDASPADAAAEAPASDARPPSTSCTGKTAQPLDSTWTVPSGGQNRAMNVHVPASYDPSVPTPVVFDFHGYTSDAAQEDILTHMNQKADSAGFVSVHANGIANSWNAGACCGTAASTHVDDVGFVSAAIDALEAKLCVDTHRVFATGMSNGGFLSQRLGCELSDRIAAIAPVAGVLGVPTCNPSRPVAVMEFHGTADTLVPYNGNPSINYPPVPDTFAGWAKRDGCTGSPVQTYSKGDTQCQTYQTCAAGVTVTLCTVTGGGHTWPGGTPVPFLGHTTTDISATDAMWDFFKTQPLP